MLKLVILFFLTDGLIGLTVNSVDTAAGLIYTTIQNGGVLKNKKGVNVPGVSTKLPGITPKMKRIFVSDVKMISTSLLHHSFVLKITY